MDRNEVLAIRHCDDPAFARQVAAVYREDAQTSRPSEAVDLLERAAAWQLRAEHLDELAPAAP